MCQTSVFKVSKDFYKNVQRLLFVFTYVTQMIFFPEYLVFEFVLFYFVAASEIVIFNLLTPRLHSFL